MPIFIAVNMDGESVCKQLVDRHYKNSKVVKLSRLTVNLFASKYFHKGGITTCSRAGNIPCAAHQQIEKDVRREVLKIGAGKDVVAPNHFFLAPDGKILFSVPYMITEGQLEWCLAEAIRRVDSSFTVQLSGSARAPRRLAFGGASSRNKGDDSVREPTKEEIDVALDILKKSGRGDRRSDAKQYFPALMLSADKRVLEMFHQWLSAGFFINQGQTARWLHAIGRVSPPEYWKVLEPFISWPIEDIRMEAIVAMEQLAEPKGLKPLLKQWKSEKKETIRGCLIRAIAASGSGNKSAEKIVLKTAGKDRKSYMRIHGLIGLVHVEDRDKVNNILRKALSHDDPGIRASAAYTIAVRRESDLGEALRAAAAAEQDKKCLVYLKAGISALDGGSLKLIEGVLREYAYDEVKRDREK